MMFQFRFSILPLLVFGIGVLTVGPSWAQDTSRSTVNVSGEGTIRAQPDQATVRFGIVTRAETAEQARSRNATAAKNAMNAVRALDVPEENMQMQALRLQPRREYNPQTETYERKGYEATRQVAVQVDRLEILPQVVAEVVQGGANRLEGIEYELSNRSEIRDEALKKAAEAARSKAQLLATTLNARLGPVHQINEQNFDFREPSPRLSVAKMTASGEAASAEPEAYAAGEIEVSAQVQVVFILRTGQNQ